MEQVSKKIREFLYGYNIKFVSAGYNTDFFNEKVDDVEFEGQINYIGKSPFDYEIKEIFITAVRVAGEPLSSEAINVINKNI